MDETYSSETSVDFQRTTRRYISEDITLQIRLEADLFTQQKYSILYL
jgi:hypothetical protein